MSAFGFELTESPRMSQRHRRVRACIHRLNCVKFSSRFHSFAHLCTDRRQLSPYPTVHIKCMDQSLEQQHRSIHQSVRARLEEVQTAGTPQFIPPYFQLPSELLPKLHTNSGISPEVAKAARVMLGSGEDAGDLPPFLRDLLGEGREQTVAQLLQYYTTRKVLDGQLSKAALS